MLNYSSHIVVEKCHHNDIVILAVNANVVTEQALANETRVFVAFYGGRVPLEDTQKNLVESQNFKAVLANELASFGAATAIQSIVDADKNSELRLAVLKINVAQVSRANRFAAEFFDYDELNCLAGVNHGFNPIAVTFARERFSIDEIVSDAGFVAPRNDVVGVGKFQGLQVDTPPHSVIGDCFSEVTVILLTSFRARKLPTNSARVQSCAP